MNNQKHGKVLQIVELMKKHGISLSEISEAIKKEQTNASFDLLCKVDGALTRVSFEEGRNKSPIGIFPFQDSLAYVELCESSFMPRFIAKETSLPTIEFFEKLFAIRDELNRRLKQLQCPIIEGDYFASLNMIAVFDGEKFEKRCAPHESAKIRYYGVHM